MDSVKRSVKLLSMSGRRKTAFKYVANIYSDFGFYTTYSNTDIVSFFTLSSFNTLIISFVNSLYTYCYMRTYDIKSVPNIYACPINLSSLRTFVISFKPASWVY